MHPRLCSSIEPLEDRIAPASTAMFMDSDGDTIMISINKGMLTPQMFVVKTAPPLPPSGIAIAGISEINLNDPAFEGAALSIKVKAAPGGDGLVDIGAINASTAFPPASGGLVTSVNLASITVQGDVGRIAVGTGLGTKAGLGALTVHSLGVEASGSQTNGLSTGAGIQQVNDTIDTKINGNLGKLNVAADIYGASIDVSGNIGPITIGGSLIGGQNYLKSAAIITGSTVFLAPGVLNPSPGNVGAIKIGGSIVGGGGGISGAFLIKGNLTSLAVGGDIVGGVGDQYSGFNFGGISGAVLVTGPAGIGAISIGGSIFGNSFAGSPNVDTTNNVYYPYDDSGSIRALAGPIKSLTVRGSIIGGAGLYGGFVQSFGAMGNVMVGGDIKGDSATIDPYFGYNTVGFNGGVQSKTSMGKVTVGGSVVGGTANYSGVVFVGREDLAIPFPLNFYQSAVTPGVNGPGGDLSGNPLSQAIYTIPAPGTGAMGTVKIGGSLIGGTQVANAQGSGQAATGWIKSDGAMGAVTIGRDIIGGMGQYSGSVESHKSILSLKVSGSIIGGYGYDSGSAIGGSPELFNNNSGAPLLPASTSLGLVTIGGSLVAGPGNLAGTLFDDSFIKGVTIYGNIVGDKNNNIANLTLPGGAILSNGGLGKIDIRGSVIGGLAISQGNIVAKGISGPNSGITSISVGHDIRGTNPGNFTGVAPAVGIYTAANLGTLTVKGSIIGNSNPGEVFILADGNIGSINVTGRVQNANILAGSTYYATVYGNVPTQSNPDAQIGSVKVGGDWIASNLVAGITSDGIFFAGPGATLKDEGLNFTQKNNNGVSSKIVSITIGGRVQGTTGTVADGFIFSAEVVGSFKQGGVALPAAFLAPLPTLFGTPLPTPPNGLTQGGVLNVSGDQDLYLITLGGS